LLKARSVKLTDSVLFILVFVMPLLHVGAKQDLLEAAESDRISSCSRRSDSQGFSLEQHISGPMLTNGIWLAARANSTASELLSLGVRGDDPILLVVREVLGILLVVSSLSLLVS
jgi:hypothetical protein